MATSATVSVKLNKYFWNATKGKHWVVEEGRWSPMWRWSSWVIEIPIPEYRDEDTGPSCCGLDEVIFSGLLDYIDGIKDNEVVEELLAKYILNSRLQSDSRVIFASCPIYQHFDRHHQPVYDRIAKILIKFGFKQLHKSPYINKNTGNRIRAFAGQF